jgi:superfamily II DNA or RNA helicase
MRIRNLVNKTHGVVTRVKRLFTRHRETPFAARPKAVPYPSGEGSRSDTGGGTASGTELLLHNQTALRRICGALSEHGMGAVVQPTGTGKSFVALKLIEETPHDNALVVSPSNHVLDQLFNAAPAVLAKTDRQTYSGLMFQNFSTEDASRYDLIVLDEYHRVGGEKWGAAVQRLRDANPDAKVIGLTATPVRHSDGMRNMTDELFDGVLASEVSLQETFQTGVLTEPKYVCALYTTGEDMAELRHAVGSSETDAVTRRKLLRRIGSYRLKGVPELLDKHLPPSTRKIMVFCPSLQFIERVLNDNEKEAREWFSCFLERVGIDIRFYTVLSSNRKKQNDNALRRFRTTTDTGQIHVLLSVDMLNEGIHVEGVDATIFLRPTWSPRIFVQQLGRCLNVGETRQKVIIDLVANVKTAMSRTFALAGDKTTSPTRRQKGQTTPVTAEVVDETVDIQQFADAIRKCLDPWWVQYDHLKAYQQAHGGALPRIGDEFPDGNSLGGWLDQQRQAYSESKLPDNRVAALSDIGVRWDAAEADWLDRFVELMAFRDRNPHCWPWQTASDAKWPGLADWCNLQRRHAQNSTLPEAYRQMLASRGFSEAQRGIDRNDALTLLTSGKAARLSDEARTAVMGALAEQPSELWFETALRTEVNPGRELELRRQWAAISSDVTEQDRFAGELVKHVLGLHKADDADQLPKAA